MAEQKKIGVSPETKDLVQRIADAESRSEARQIEYWAKQDAKRLGIGTKIVPRPKIPTASTLPENINTNEAGQNAGRNSRHN